MQKMDFADERSRSTSTMSNDGQTEEVRAKEFDKNRSQGNVLFVGNLPFQTPWQNVKDQFRRAGKVRYTDLVADRMGRPKGSALVTMSTSEGARRAIRLFNETEFEGRRLIVRLFDDGPRPALVPRENMPAYNRRSVRPNGPAQAASSGPNNGQQQGGNQQRGAQQQQQQRQNNSNNKPQQQQQQQQQQRQNKQQGGNQQQGEVPKPRSQQVPEADRKLFISNLPFDCTSAALRETFQQIGTVERSEIIVGRNGKSRGMGIVVLGTQEEARVAIAEFDGIEMAGRAMNVRLDNKA
jgi:RNA recognition motif-containing protein